VLKTWACLVDRGVGQQTLRTFDTVRFGLGIGGAAGSGLGSSWAWIGGAGSSWAWIGGAAGSGLGSGGAAGSGHFQKTVKLCCEKGELCNKYHEILLI